MFTCYALKNKLSEHTAYYLNLSRAVLGEMNEALTPTKKLVKKYPHNIEYLKLLGSIQHTLHQYEQAITTFKRALKINDADVQTLSNIASAYKENKRLDKAETFFKKSLSIQPNQANTLTNYGLLLQTNGRPDDAIKMHQKAIQLEPENYTTLYNLAYALNDSRKHDESLQIYLKIINAYPNHVKALCDIANVFGQLQQYEQALPYLQHAMNIEPDDIEVHLNFGHIHRLMKNTEMAVASYNEVLRIDHNHQSAKYFIAMMKGDDSITKSPYDYVQTVFDTYADNFDDHLTSKLQYKTPELIAEMVKKLYGTAGKYKILDLGCGTGLACHHLQGLSEYMVGVDLSPKMIKKAEERKIYDQLVVSGIDEYFDKYDYDPNIVISADVFVYIGDISNIFSAVSKSMQSNGIFIFSIESTDTDDSFMLKESGRFGHNDKYIQTLADKNNFRIVEALNTVLRTEAGKPINGQIFLLKK